MLKILSVDLSSENISEDALPILKLARPNWFSPASVEDSPPEIRMRVFSGGITNKLVGFYIDLEPEDIVVVKLYGEKTDLLIDREKEVKTMQLLHEKKCGPELYAVFNNGIAYGYSPGNTLDVLSCRDENVYSLVAREMARMHSIIPIIKPEHGQHGGQGDGDETDSKIWFMLQNFQNLVSQVFDLKPELKEKLQALGINNQWCESVIQELKTLCEEEKPKMPVVFCHNDLLLGNIIYDERRSKISFIDFEYAAPNYAPFDIANHFNEFAGVDEADFSLCPDEGFMRQWLTHYAQSYTNSVGFDNMNVDLLLRWVQLCQPISHLMWILWSIYQACHSEIDFDFVGYVAIRLPEFNKGMQLLRK